TINTNSTLKFFAKDSYGSVSPVVTAGYTIISPLTVSTSTPGGTYNATQSVTLTASRPGTIYYTKDGSVPTVSSPNGPSQVTIIVNTTSTLKYFSKDNSGNTGPTGSASYTITIPTVNQMSDTTGTTGLSVYSGRQLQTEYITPSSILKGKSIDTITVYLKKI